MIQYNHPSIVVEEQSPGYFVIAGHHPQSFFIEEQGHTVPPDTCVIPKEIPSDLLRAIADAKDGGKGLTVEKLKKAQTMLSDADVGTGLVERVLNVLAEGNIQVTKLAERLDVEKSEIQALDGTSEEFHIARGGWVKLGKKEGEE